jgi:hypothetical protein
MASNLWVSVDAGHSFFKVNFPDKLAEGVRPPTSSPSSSSSSSLFLFLFLLLRVL